jgi:eukaryotic-like serine/threonine-protein kinase
MSERTPPPPPDDDETVVVPPDETVAADEWAVPPERRATGVEPATRVATEEEEVVPPRRRPPLLWPGLLALLVLVLAGLGLAWWLAQDDDEPAGTTTAAAQVVVPRVVGLTEERARDRLEAAELEAEVETRADDGPAGVVLEQLPEDGSHVDRGSEVRLVVSQKQGETTTGETTTGETTTGQTTTGQTTTAPQTVRVPEVVGRTSSEASATLRDAGFEVALVQVPSNDQPGSVVAQNPPAGAEAERGSEVRLNIAEAPPEPSVVPDAVGLPAADAAGAFGEQGLRVALRYVPSNEAAGTVVAQARPAGTELDRGATVQVNVSVGAQPAANAPVPDVAGQPLDEARETLSGAGFEVLALNLSEDVRRTDTVERQTPAARASVPRGSLVVLYVRR